MAEFSGKIVSAYYADQDHSVIKVLYEENDLLTPWHLPVDESNPEYQELLAEGWDEERLLDETAERLKAESRAFNIEVNNAARAMLGLKELQDERDRLMEEKQKAQTKVEEQEQILIGLDKEVKVKTNQIDNQFFEMVWQANENKEELFKFKLWALELDFVQNADKEIKSNIRRCTSLIDGLNIIHGLSKQQ